MKILTKKWTTVVWHQAVTTLKISDILRIFYQARFYTNIHLLLILKFSIRHVSIRDRSQENAMNAHGSFYSLAVLNQPNKIITINTKQTKYFRVVLKESHTGGKRNDNIYIHCSASADHGVGCLRTFLVSTIQVYPSARLLVY
jgi:hypothetical protein